LHVQKVSFSYFHQLAVNGRLPYSMDVRWQVLKKNNI
jgi:hypothetical protein